MPSGAMWQTSSLVEKGKLVVAGAVYSLDTGKVTWLPDGTARAVALAVPAA